MLQQQDVDGVHHREAALRHLRHDRPESPDVVAIDGVGGAGGEVDDVGGGSALLRPHEEGDLEMFWGIRYAPARLLNAMIFIENCVKEQSLPSDMLFCLHDRLYEAHKYERPEIQKLVVRAGTDDQFTLLDSTCGNFSASGNAPEVIGASVLRYLLHKGNHNMVHFACHCLTSNLGDVLNASLIDDEKPGVHNTEFKLQTQKFLNSETLFKRQPLVFLNACRSGGASDATGITFNLPNAFFKCGAAAIIATACPVPDLFAASFARVFYQKFLKDMLTIGKALQETRRYFIEKHNNPLGLAYGLYTPANYRMSQQAGDELL